MRRVSARPILGVLSLGLGLTALGAGVGWARPATPAAAAAAKVYLAGDCVHAQTAPATVTLTCGDGNTYLTGLRWTHWNTGTASASGTLNVNTCEPNCADGHLETFPASLQVSGAKACGRSHKVQYTKASLVLSGKRPSGVARKTSYALVCV